MVQTPRAVNYKLTDKKIIALKAREKPYPVTDGGGLFVEVLVSGSKVWRYAYIVKGKRGKVTIGAYPSVGIKAARDSHEIMRGDVAKGIDPARQKQLDKIEAQAAETQAQTFQDFAQIWLTEKQSTLTARSQKQKTSWLTNDIYPAIGAIQLGKVHAADVRDLLESLRNTPVKAEGVRSIIQQIYNYAALKLLVTYNPATQMKGLVEKPRVAHYKPLEISQIPGFVEAFKTSNAHPGTRLALELLMLTAVRKDNVCKARWEHFDLAAKTWTIPGRTVGGNGFMKMPEPHTVYLSEQAMKVLSQARELSSRSEWVFPSVTQRSTPMGEVSINHLLRRLKASGDCPPDFAPHGLRSTFSTICNESTDISPDVIEVCLAHQERNAVRAAYNRAKYASQCKVAMQWYADRLDQIIKVADVIQLRA